MHLKPRSASPVYPDPGDNQPGDRQGFRGSCYLFLFIFFAGFVASSGCMSPPPLLDEATVVTPLPPEAGPVPVSLPVTYPAPAGMLTVRFLDVGLGDAILVQSPSGKTILIDAGPGLMNRSLVYGLDAAGVKGFDVVIATHPHEDHIGGMRTVLNKYPVNRFIDSGMPHTTATYQALVKQLKDEMIPYEVVRAGDIVPIEPGLIFRVLNPDGSLISAEDNENIAENLNENSLVLSLAYGNVTFLFMGDATTEAEQFLLSEWAELDADILKVAHHGSSRSSGSRFLERVSPGISVIEVGSGNPYGYPAPATLQRIQKAGSWLYRTDQNGTVVITTDGRSYQVLVERGNTVSTSLPLTARASA